MIAIIFCKWNNKKQRTVLFKCDSSSCVLFFLKDFCDFFDHYKHFLPFYFPSSSFSASLSKKVVVTFLPFSFSCCLVWCTRRFLITLASRTFCEIFIPSFTRGSRYWALSCGKLGVLVKALFPLLEEASLCLKSVFERDWPSSSLTLKSDSSSSGTGIVGVDFPPEHEGEILMGNYCFRHNFGQQLFGNCMCNNYSI